MGLFQFLSRRKPESEPVKVSPPSIVQDKLKAVLYGLAIGDALGVPFDILPRMNAGDSRISRFGFLFDTTRQEGRGR